MKKAIIIFVAALFTLSVFAGCTIDGEKLNESEVSEEVTTETVVEANPTAAPEETVEAEEQKIQVGFIATNYSSEAQARVAEAFEEYAASKGWEVVALNSMGSIEEQSKQLENLVQMEVDGIVMAMGHPTEIKDAMNMVFDAGIPIVTIDSGYTDGVVADITSDNFSMGATISTYMANSLGGSGNIIVVKFEKHAGCRQRGKVLDVVLSEYPDINVLEEYSVVATKSYLEDTRKAVETFVLKYGDEIDGIWCAFDQLAYVSADTLIQNGIEDAIVVGIDGNEETFKRINEGTMSATVAQPFSDMAEMSIDILEDMIVNELSAEEAAPSKIIYVDAPLITEANVSTMLGE